MSLNPVFIVLHFVDSLQSSLDSPLLNDFIAALEQLTNPEMVFKVCFAQHHTPTCTVSHQLVHHCSVQSKTSHVLARLMIINATKLLIQYAS